MKNIFRVFTLILLALFMVVGVTACDSSKKDQELLNSFLIEQDGKTLTSDFVLPAYLKIEEKGEEVVYDLVWSSNNGAIQLEQRKDDEGKVVDYLAKVTYPEEEAVVTLTVTLGKVSKEFTVRVSPIDVYNFSGTYVFPNDKQKVYKDFDLDQECSFAGKKATITWSVDEAYQAYIKISEDGKKCLVTQNSLDPEVKIKATFTYKGESTTKQYKMTVSQEPTHEEAVSSWYNNPGSPNNFSGWIVEIATVYSESYGNVSFYVLDENEDAGYYGYRVKVAAGDAAKIKVGAYVTVTGSTNTMYNGLMETNAGAFAEFDESKNLTAEQMAAKVKALDEDILAGSPAAFFNQSRLVSLNSWKITKVGGEKDSFLFEITKEGVTVQIRTSKYFEGAYSVSNEDQMAPFKALQTTLAVGDYVNVTGVLGRYESEHPEDLQKGINISPLKATDVVKAEAEAEGTAHPGKDVKALISAMNELMPTSGLIPSNRELTYATSNEAGATVELEVLHGNNNVVANNEEGKLTITPSIEEKVSVLAKFACGEYKTQIVYILHLKAMTPEELIDATFDELELADLNTFGELPYPTKNGTYGTSISYQLVSEQTANVKVDESGKITVSPLAQEELTLKVTVSLGDDHKEKEIKVNLLKLESSTIAEFLGMKSGDMAILEGTVVAVNKDGVKGSFVLADASGAIFSYSGENVVLGDKVKLVGALAFNNDTPQIDKIQILEKTENATADLAKALEAAGTPTELEVSSIHDKLAELTTHVAIVKEYSGKFLKIHGFVVKKGSYMQLMVQAQYENVDNEKGFVSIYAAPSLSVASYEGKEVNLYGYFRGDSIGNYVTIQVTKLEFVNAADAADCLTADAELKLTVGEEKEIKVTVAPFAPQGLTYEAISGNEQAVKVEMKDGKLVATGLAAAEDVEVTITPSQGNAIKVKVTVTASQNKSFIAEALKAAEALENKTESTKMYLVIGTISEIQTAYSEQFSNVSFYLSDGTDRILIFRYNLADAATVKVGDQLALFGKVKKYNSDLEMVSAEKFEGLTALSAFTKELTNATVYGKVKSIDTAYNSQYNNISITITDGTTDLYIYRLTGGETLAEGDYVLITGNGGEYKGNVQMAQGGTYTASAEYEKPAAEPTETQTIVHAGTEEDPYTVEDAILFVDSLGSDTSTTEIYVKGVVFSSKYSSQYNNYEIWLKTSEKDKAFELYATIVEGDFQLADALKNYEVVAKGYAKKYNGTYELTNVTIDNVKYNPVVISKTPVDGAHIHSYTFAGYVWTEDTSAFGWKAQAKLVCSGTDCEKSELLVDLVVSEDKDQYVPASTTSKGKKVLFAQYTGQEKSEKEVELDFIEMPVLDKEVVFSFAELTGKGSSFNNESLTAVFASDKVGVTVSESNKIYNGNSNGGALENTAGLIKTGTSSANGTFTLTLDKKVTKIAISLHDFYKQSADYMTNSNTISVNGSEAALVPYNETATPATMVFEFAEATNVITITVSKRAYIFSITLQPAEASANQTE